MSLTKFLSANSLRQLIKALHLFALAQLIYIPLSTYAAPIEPPSGSSRNGIINPALKNDLGGLGIPDPDPANIFGRFIGSWWGVAYVSGGVIFLLYLAWGAVEWAISGSNKDRVEGAKSKIQNALFGLTLLAASFALVKAVGFVLGIDLLETLTFDLSRIAP